MIRQLAALGRLPSRQAFSTAMQIGVGDRVPMGVFQTIEVPEEGCVSGAPLKISTDDLFSGKTVVMVGIPGAFTPTCSDKHIPGFINHVEEFKKKGVDTVACISTNDAYVLGYWARQLGNRGRIHFLSDGNGSFLKEIGLTWDLSGHNMGLRSKRFAMVVKDGIVKHVAVDSGPVLGTSADTILANLKDRK